MLGWHHRCVQTTRTEAPIVSSPSIATILRDHVSLSISCIDRLYLNGYVPLLQKKDAIAAQQHARFADEDGVVFIGIAQEKATSFKGHKQTRQPGVSFTFSRQPVYVNQYYFYLQDREWGPAFIKIGSYLPYPVRLCLNAHEWAKQQARRQELAFESLDNGVRWCADPARLQRICDRLSPSDVQRFFDRWMQQLPWPLTRADRAAGYRHRLTIWQLEVSLTQVFDAPHYGRQFFETLIADNL